MQRISAGAQVVLFGLFVIGIAAGTNLAVGARPLVYNTDVRPATGMLAEAQSAADLRAGVIGFHHAVVKVTAFQKGFNPSVEACPIANVVAPPGLERCDRTAVAPMCFMTGGASIPGNFIGALCERIFSLLDSAGAQTECHRLLWTGLEMGVLLGAGIRAISGLNIAGSAAILLGNQCDSGLDHGTARVPTTYLLGTYSPFENRINPLLL